MSGKRAWHLVADIGGTHGRFAVVDALTGAIAHRHTVAVEDSPEFDVALDLFLAAIAETASWQAHPEASCLAVASSDDGEEVLALTNSAWVIHTGRVARRLGLERVDVLNDFAAIGYALPGFGERDWLQIGAGHSREGSPCVVLGPGTGLGVCAVVPVAGNGVTVLSGEGGHGDYAPVDDDEIEVLRLLRGRFGRVSMERVFSGMGLQNLYWALAQLHGVTTASAAPGDRTPAQITVAAREGADPVAVHALALFFRGLGSIAGNLALAFGAHGGVYLAGGILPRLADSLSRSEFRERFLAKGRFEAYLSDVPTRLVTRKDPGLEGAARYLGRGLVP